MKHDYDLSELERVTVRGLAFNLMPRYKYHYLDHDYERFSLDLLDVLVADGSTAIDIGGHYGIYSLLAAKKAKHVYAFEPVLENYKVLEKNVYDNAFDNVTVINKAVSDKPGELEFNIPWASDSAGFHEHPNAESIRKVQVQVAAIDEELKDISNVSFIKIDTEGHEMHVLEGMKKTIRNNKQAKLLLEFNPECLERAGYQAEDLIKKLFSLEYDIFAVYEDDRHLARVTKTMTASDILTEGRTYLNFLCLQKNTWISAAFVSHSASIGGAELWLYELVSGLTHTTGKFVLPYVILPAKGPLVDKIKSLPVASCVIPMRGWVGTKELDNAEREQIAAVNVEGLAALTTLFTSFCPQTVFTNSITIPWGAIIAQNIGVPHIWSINEFGDLDHDLPFDYPYEQILSMIAEFSQVVLVNSRAVERHLAKVINTNKLRLVYQYVPQPKLSAHKPKNVFSSKATMRLVITGRIMESKGQMEAIRALDELRTSGNEAELLIVGAVGSPAYKRQIQDFCKQRKLDAYVHFVGHQDNPYDYVSMADAALMCSRSEAYGRVTIEAMLLGVPVVGSDTGATPELIISGKTGYLYKYDNPKDLAKQITKLEKGDRHIMGMAAQEHTRTLLRDGYDQILRILVQTSKVMTLNPVPLVGDLLRGVALLEHNWHAKELLTSETHQKEITDFSDKYNAVYAAYNEVVAQLTQINEQIDTLHLRKALRMKEKFTHAVRRHTKNSSK